MEELDWEKVKGILELQHYRSCSRLIFCREDNVEYTLGDLHELLDSYLEQKEGRSTRCVWKYYEEYVTDDWETECGEAHILADGTPAENNMRFCPYCGRRIEQLDQE